jgi:hypothetical protein
MTKKSITITVIILILLFSILLYFIPINSILGKLPFLDRFYNNTTLEIVTKKGKARIWINGKDYGETPNTIENLAEGTYLVELEKIGDEKFFYEKQSIQVELTRNTSARIDIEIGPDNILHGSIIYYTPIRTSTDEGFLTVISNVDGAKIFLDKEFLKSTPVSNLNLRENQYQVKVTAQGYEEIEVPVLVRNNYSLNLKTYHFPIPTQFDLVETTETINE